MRVWDAPGGGWRDQVLPWLPAEVRSLLERVDPARLAEAEELRLRAGRPIHLVFADGDAFVGSGGELLSRPDGAPPVGPEVVRRAWTSVCEASVYSREEEARQGFVCLPGGHRVGVAGRFACEGGRILGLREVGGLNFRLARARPGCASPLLPALADPSGLPYHTLIVGPPGAGKTTLLRDLVRQLSAGRHDLGLPGLRVALVDERGEVAACRAGVPQLDVGPRTDVLDRCPKPAGIVMALRALAPQVVAFDELGGEEDARAVVEAARAGVRVVCTVHAASLEEAAARPALAPLFRPLLFGAWVVLSRRGGRPGAVAAVGRAGAGPAASAGGAARAGVLA